MPWPLSVKQAAKITIAQWKFAAFQIIIYPAEEKNLIARGGGDFAYEKGGDARRKFWIKPLKGTDLGVAQAFFGP